MAAWQAWHHQRNRQRQLARSAAKYREDRVEHARIAASVARKRHIACRARNQRVSSIK